MQHVRPLGNKKVTPTYLKAFTYTQNKAEGDVSAYSRRKFNFQLHTRRKRAGDLWGRRASRGPQRPVAHNPADALRDRVPVARVRIMIKLRTESAGVRTTLSAEPCPALYPLTRYWLAGKSLVSNES